MVFNINIKHKNLTTRRERENQIEERQRYVP